ncbi:hypothetical protein NRK67_16830 (plasmid) [Fusobacteria bacterium ZRK30]|nr:hypothetical protein NRK67_16830 [Fusobacteria bacterium ZRK30]
MKLEELCDIKIGVQLLRHKIKEKEEEKEKLKKKSISLKSIENFGLSEEKIEEIYLKKDVSSEYYTRKGDILLKLAKPNDVVSISNEIGIIIPHHFAILRIKENMEVDPKYLSYLLGSNKIKRQINKTLEGGSVSILKTSYLKGLDIEIPNLETQNKYRNFWDLISKKSKLLKKKCELMDKYNSKLFGNI